MAQWDNDAKPAIHAEKRASSNWMPCWGWGKPVLVTAVLFLVAGVAVDTAGGGTGGTADQGTGTRVARLVADDGTGTRAEQAAGDRATLGVGSGGSRAVGEGEGGDDAGERQKC